MKINIFKNNHVSNAFSNHSQENDNFASTCSYPEIEISSLSLYT